MILEFGKVKPQLQHKQKSTPFTTIKIQNTRINKQINQQDTDVLTM